MSGAKAAPRIKNYTSELSIEESIGIIQRTLAQHKARRIIFEHDEAGEPSGLLFELVINQRSFTFRMPLRFEGTRRRVAEAHRAVGRPLYDDRLEEQTRRTAWANIKDWILAQMALIDAEAVKLEEIFFPYLLEGDRTAFEVFEEQLALPEPGRRDGRVHIEEVR